jgi:hypothetical protein
VPFYSRESPRRPAAVDPLHTAKLPLQIARSTARYSRRPQARAPSAGAPGSDNKDLNPPPTSVHPFPLRGTLSTRPPCVSTPSTHL